MAQPPPAPPLPGQFVQPVRAWATPEKFSGDRDSDWTSWLAHFRRVALANNWNQAQQSNYIGLYLKGNALSFYEGLDNAIRVGALQPLLDEMAQRFGDVNRMPTIRVELQTRRQHRGESLSDFAEVMRKLARRAYPTLAGAVQDGMARDQFVSGLDSRDLRLHVRGADPQTLDDALRRAMHFQCILDTDEGPQPPSTANICAVQPPPAALTTTLQTLTNRMAAMEAKLTALTTPSQGPPQDSRRRCYICESIFHLSPECPHKDKAPDNRRRKDQGNPIGPL